MASVTLNDVFRAVKTFYEDGHKTNSNRASEDRFSIGLANLLRHEFEQGSDISVVQVQVSKGVLSNFLEAVGSPNISSLYSVTEVGSTPMGTLYDIREAAISL